MRQKLKLPGIQGLRGVAVALVVLYHFDLAFPNGYLGVDVFFAISGFVISRLIHEQLQQKSFSFKAFYLARLLRLFPALAATVLVTFTASLFLANESASQKTWITGIASLFGVSNVVAQLVSTDYFAESSRANPLLHTWSLGVEEQFYLALPLVMFLIYRIRRSFVNVGLLLIGLVALVSFVLFVLSDAWQGLPFWGSVFGYYSPITRAWEFLSGGLAYLLRIKIPDPTKIAYLLTFWPGVALLATSMMASVSEQGLPSWINYLAAVGGTSLVLYSQGSFVKQNVFLSSRPMIWLGDRSYSIYLWHWPLVVIWGWSFVNPNTMSSFLLLALLLSIGAVSYWCLEVHVRRRLVSIAPRHLIKGTIAFAITLSLAMAAAYTYLPREDSELYSQRTALPIIYEAGCHDKMTICLDELPIASFITKDRNVYLVGDSNAAQHYPGLDLATNELNLNLYSLTASGCPGLSINVKGGDGSFQEAKCEIYRAWLNHKLTEAPEGTVVLGFTLDYVEDWNLGIEEARNSLGKALGEFQSLARKNGHRLIVIEPIPYWGGDYTNFTPELLPRSVPDPLAFRYESWRDSLGPISKWPNFNLETETKILPTHGSLCPGGELCYVFKNGKFNFRDATHITTYFSETMVGGWKYVLRESK